ncbi:MAG: hypothetical protein H6748_00545 [Spirochaetaceae bacterium]|nr:hypothetical protein [Spirochaetaceae bacterium]HPG24178.1 hypothetical protein [Myxococcota bacterium]
MRIPALPGSIGRSIAPYLAAGVAALAPGLARAQVSIADDPAPRFAWRGHVANDFLYETETETDGGDSFEAWHLGLSGDFGGPINESILVGVSGGYRYADYDWKLDNALGTPPGYGGAELPKDPWGSVHTFDVAPEATILVGRQFAVVGAVPIRWAGETGAHGNGFIAGVSGLVRWAPIETLSIGAGIGITSQLEGEAETYPVVSLDWQVTPALRLATEGSWAMGGRTSLAWGPAEAVQLALSLGYERVRFRLDDHGRAPDRNGVAEIRSIPLEGTIRLHLAERVQIELRGGVAFGGRFRIERRTGAKLYDQHYDPAPRIGFAITVPLGWTAARADAPRRAPAAGGDPTAPDAPGAW